MTPYIVCHECDLLHHVPSLPERGVARCGRCGAELFRHRPNSIERTLALTIAGLVLFVLANVFPFLAFEIKGDVTQTTLITGVDMLFREGQWALAALVFLTSIAAPALRLSSLFYVHLALYRNRTPWKLAAVFRFTQHLLPWSMMEVFLVGILVAFVKLAKMATIVPGLALWSFAALIVVMASISTVMDSSVVWDRLEARQ